MPGSTLAVDTGHHGPIYDARMNVYGNRLATCSNDGMVKIFEVRENSMAPLTDLCGHKGPIWQVSWAGPRFGTMCASAGYDCQMIVWKETENGWQKHYVYDEHKAAVNTVAFAPDRHGLLLASGSCDGSIRIHTSDDLHESWTTKVIENAHSHGVNAISWAPALIPESRDAKLEKRFVSCGNDQHLKIWTYRDNDKWELEKVLLAHTDFIRDVAWCPTVYDDLHKIISVGLDRKVYLWRCGNVGKEEWRFEQIIKARGALSHVSWSPCGTFFTVSGEDNQNLFFREDGNQWSQIKEDGLESES